MRPPFPPPPPPAGSAEGALSLQFRTPQSGITARASAKSFRFMRPSFVHRTVAEREAQLEIRLLHGELRRCAAHLGIEASRVRIGELDRAGEALPIEDLRLLGALRRRRDRLFGD